MSLEEQLSHSQFIAPRASFQSALLEYKSTEEWKESRFSHQSIYYNIFHFEGRELTGSELIGEYATRFPVQKDTFAYSDRAQLNRMLAECHIPQFSFLDQEVLRGFLLSAKSEKQWEKYQPSYHTFWDVNFQYAGIDLKGQMLLYNLFVELENKKNNTYYAFIDYTLERSSEMHTLLRKSSSGSFISSVFERAGLAVKGKRIEHESLDAARLREILLSRRTEQEWEKWDGGWSDFQSTWFDLKSYRN